MKRNTFLFVMLFILGSSVFCQSFDLPNWIQPGMSLENTIKISKDLNIYLYEGSSNSRFNTYLFVSNNIIYIMLFSIYDNNIYGVQISSSSNVNENFLNALSNLTTRYGSHDEIFNGKHLWMVESFNHLYDANVWLSIEIIDNVEYVLIEYGFSRK